MTPAAAQRKPVTLKQQLQFGVEMAQRGLWSEALFRFKQAEKMAPESSAVVNNLAVAHEALGLFDEAMVYYRQALELAPNDRSLKRNYSRFVEFYQGYKRPVEGEEKEEGGGAPAESAPPTTESGTRR